MTQRYQNASMPPILSLPQKGETLPKRGFLGKHLS